MSNEPYRYRGEKVQLRWLTSHRLFAGSTEELKSRFGGLYTTDLYDHIVKLEKCPDLEPEEEEYLALLRKEVAEYEDE